MKNNITYRVIFIIFSIVLSVSMLNAAKVKSSKKYLNQLNKKIEPLVKNLDSTKSILKMHTSSRSFVSTDFWGLKPSWYVNGSGANIITTQYPYTESWLNKYGIWKKYSSNLVRNINGVILTPISSRYMRLKRNDPREWKEYLNVEFDFSPGYRNSKYYKEYVKSYLTSNGIPSSKISDALEYFESKAESAITLMSDNVFRRFDKLYDGVAKFGYMKAYENLAQKANVNIDDYTNPVRHQNIFTEELFTKYESTLNIKSRKSLNAQFDNWANKASLYEYYKNSYNLTVKVPIQYFEVASGMSKSQKYNQINKLKDMLDKKVSSGKVKKTKEGNYTVYEDSFDKYTRGRIAINLKTGYGYWRASMWKDRKYIQYYFEKIQKNVKNANKALEKYLSLSLDETVKKFKNNSSQTNDF